MRGRRLFIMFFILILLFIEKVPAYASTHNGIRNVSEEKGGPRLVLDSYKVTNGAVVFGDEIILKLVLKNTSESFNIHNILISYMEEDNLLYPAEGESNQLFVDDILAGETAEVEVKLVAERNAVDIVKMVFAFQYQDSYEHYFNNQTDIQFSIMQKCTLDIDSLSVMNTTSIGSKTLLSINYGNSRTEDVYNAVMKIKGDIKKEQKRVALGNVASGEQKSLDYYVNFQSVGEKKLKISFTYENKKGDKFSLNQVEYKVNVEEKDGETKNDAGDKTQSRENGNKKANVGKVILVAFIAVVLIIGILYIEMKRRENNM